jgi:DNA-binding PadR family transcriptional regulator
MQRGRTSGSGGTGGGFDPERTLQASVNWAVLGLVIEKPSYGYEIGRRFMVRFGEFVPASLSNIYTTLDRLVRLGLLEPTHIQAASSSGRQHKLHYRATSSGARAYRGWLARKLREVDNRSELMLRLLSVCVRGVLALDEVLERYEGECIEEQERLQASPQQSAEQDSELMPDLLNLIVEDERQTVLAAQLDWVRRTRALLRDRLERQRRRAAAAMQRQAHDRKPE